MKKDQICTHKGPRGRCTRPAKWTWDDDNMQTHYLCTQHLKKVVPQGTHVMTAPIPRCHGNTRYIKCEMCGRYKCLFQKVETEKTTQLVNRGRGLHRS